MANAYNKSVSNMDFTGKSGGSNEKLMNPTAREHPDEVNSNNELKQYEGGKSAGKYGKLGKQGKDF